MDTFNGYGDRNGERGVGLRSTGGKIFDVDKE